MDDPVILEFQVFAFLDHLKQHKRQREHLEHVLLREIIEIAKQEGFDFSAKDFRDSVGVVINYGLEDIRWPPRP